MSTHRVQTYHSVQEADYKVGKQQYMAPLLIIKIIIVHVCVNIIQGS